MEIDGTVAISISEPTVDVCLCGSSRVDSAVSGSLEVRSDFRGIPIKRPYLINLNNVEYVEGDWNDDRTEYGIRIGYVSGNTRCFWGSTARKVLKEMLPHECKEEFMEKFDDRVKAGPPAV